MAKASRKIIQKQSNGIRNQLSRGIISDNTIWAYCMKIITLRTKI